MLILKTKSVLLSATVPTEPDGDKEYKLAKNHPWHWSVPGHGTPPILLQDLGDGAYKVCDGHHRRLAAIRRGDTEITAYIMPPGITQFSGFYVEWDGRFIPYGEMWGVSWRSKFVGIPISEKMGAE